MLINVIVGFSCSSTVDQQPAIPSSQMVELLIDIHILEARVDKLRVTNDSAYAIYNTLESEIFKQYDVSKEYYEYSYQYYLTNPKLLDQIYGVVVDSLNLIQKRGYQKQSELAVLDSALVEKAVLQDFPDKKIKEAKKESLKSLPKEKVLKAKENIPLIETQPTIKNTTLPSKRAKLISRDSLRVRNKNIAPAEITQDSLK
ncbi:protein of unknown function [Reichenbachiella faecimaris]|uniref:DUF4296 domain-containing protein n=1 Tax=Reichenbachiella faecimaris TaxID=692418 RepID=A0A1W2G7A4_REIFA|nr:protein of unknown function [Reichenbachiella faecimaris]